MLQRLTDPCAIYEVLAALQVGDVAPPELYIADYEDGGIPQWTLISRRPTGAPEQLELIFEDRTPQTVPLDMWAAHAADLLPRRGVLTWPERTLATRIYLCEEVAWRCPRQQMGSLIQQARIENKRQQRVVAERAKVS